VTRLRSLLWVYSGPSTNLRFFVFWVSFVVSAVDQVQPIRV